MCIVEGHLPVDFSFHHQRLIREGFGFFFFFNKIQMSSALNCRECGIDLIKVPDD